MRKWDHHNRILVFCILLCSISSCVKENAMYVSPVTKGDNVAISFVHFVDGELLKLDTMAYETSLKNRYMVTDLQYFISCVRLHQAGGKWIDINPDCEIHYVDLRIPKTWSWILSRSYPDMTADSVSFVFGLDCGNNISFRFPDPPERDMFWPEVLGGGYHYMKLNMKWKNAEMTEMLPFMFHLGTGQVYKGNVVNTDSIIGFVPNFFTVTFPFTPVMKSGGAYSNWVIRMNVGNWFDGAYAFDFSDYPKGIMQNQEGMFKATQNGKKAFEFQVLMPDK